MSCCARKLYDCAMRFMSVTSLSILGREPTAPRALRDAAHSLETALLRLATLALCVGSLTASARGSASILRSSTVALVACEAARLSTAMKALTLSSLSPSVNVGGAASASSSSDPSASTGMGSLARKLSTSNILASTSFRSLSIAALAAAVSSMSIVHDANTP